jgi:phage terminase large subunit GpA-like protein
MQYPELESIDRAVDAIWSPPPDLKVSEWADQYRRLSAEASAEPGQWRTDRAPYQREIMDAFNDPRVDTVAMMSSAQVGKTEILLNVIGYFAHQDPSPRLAVLPTLEIAEAYSKDRIAPMVRDTPELTKLIADAKSRDSGNTLLHKRFPGGHLTLAGANSAASLASRPIRIVLNDEVDRYPTSAGTEGDPVKLSRKRTNNFWNRKIGMFSTPTTKGISRIESEWDKSDQRRYFVPCPHCGRKQHLEWSNIVYDDDKPETAAYACRECGSLIQESHKSEMINRGQWRATSVFRGVAGFHLNELYSPWKRWSDVVTDYIDAKGKPEEEKIFWNTSLGLPYEDVDGALLEPETLQSRRESWRATLLPAETVLLTAGVDVQEDRLEAVMIAWAMTGQMMIVERRVFEGSPSFPQVWLTLDEWLLDDRTTETQGTLRIRAACIDSGGHHTQAVYDFCTSRAGRDVFAIKGADGAIPAWPDRSSASRKYRGHKVWRIGVDTIKDIIRARLALTEGDGRVRFAADLSPEFFRQLVVERRVVKTDRRGRPVRMWVKPSGARNESFDCTVYGMAALEALKKIRRLTLAKMIPPVRIAEDKPASKPNGRTIVKRSIGRRG